ncbi:hypothetical protein NMG60_11020487 [Bertholletia excelsa]
MVSSKKLAGAVGGKTARACDSCIKKRARWYCAADDAFLCQACDASVHSANPLAQRHERVRLKTSSFKSSDDSPVENFVPSWHRGFTKRARTPRHGKRKCDEVTQSSHPLVPDLGNYGETSNEETNDEQALLYRVPIFDPMVAELCTTPNSNEAETANSNPKAVIAEVSHSGSRLHGFLPSEMELAEFAADVESLLGKGLDEGSFDMKALESLSGGKIKIEQEEEDKNSAMMDVEMDMTKEPFELSFDYDSHVACDELEEKVEGGGMTVESSEQVKTKKKILLSLDYEGVITAWADQRCPWTTGYRPELDPTECWPACLGGCGSVHYPYREMGLMGGHGALGDGGREARVSRYREKRRTRMFSKKIRYEVRKLNAEKRPRMKGRFVKRASFAGPSAFPLLNK